MRMPRSLKVGPHTFRVKSGPKINRLLASDDANGHTIADYSLIRVCTDRPHTQQAVTLLHEALHAVWSTTTLRRGEDELEEETITAITATLLAVLRDNPEFVAFLLADE